MYFAGDGHTHWHVRDLETYELIRSDNGSKVGTGASPENPIPSIVLR